MGSHWGTWSLRESSGDRSGSPSRRSVREYAATDRLRRRQRLRVEWQDEDGTVIGVELYWRCRYDCIAVRREAA